MNETGNGITALWAVKAILLQLCALLVSVMIVAAIITYITPMKISYRLSLNIIIFSASIIPVWQIGRTLKRRFSSWLFGSAAGVIAYLSTKTLWLSLFKSGILDANKASELAGFSSILGLTAAMGVSYMLNRLET